MKPALTLLTASLMLIMAACANGPSRAELAAQEASRQAAEERAGVEAEAAARRAADEAEFERLESEIAQQRARQQAELEAEERRLAADAEARAREAEAAARRRAQAAETEGQRQQQASAATGSAREQEQAVARQQARIAELRAQLTVNQAETAKKERANDALREAISAAEQLTEVLASEHEKYSNANQTSGQTAGALSKADIEALSAEVDRLRAMATELAAQANP